MKNNILYVIFIYLIVVSCSGGGDEPTPTPTPNPTPNPTPEAQNTAPSVPGLVSPTPAQLCISNTVVFGWNVSVDAESNNPIVYQLQIATDNLFTQNVITKEISTPTHTELLVKGKAYYWRVKATDSKGAASAYSTVSSFYTEGTAVTNHAPFLPQLVAPVANAIISGTTTTLKWSGSDVDNDVLSYDVYLGTTSSPSTKVVDNKTTTSYDATLQATTIYYWKVVVKDAKGGETQGQVWSFRTN